MLNPDKRIWNLIQSDEGIQFNKETCEALARIDNNTHEGIARLFLSAVQQALDKMNLTIENAVGTLENYISNNITICELTIRVNMLMTKKAMLLASTWF